MRRANKGLITVIIIFSMFCLAEDDLQGDVKVYTFQQGDTLFNIALKYGVSVDTLKSYNQIKDPTKIRRGTLIKIPEQQEVKSTSQQTGATFTYKVKQGDTLFNIAKRYNITLNELLRINNISSTKVLKINDELKIPLTNASSSPSTLAENTKPFSLTSSPSNNPIPDKNSNFSEQTPLQQQNISILNLNESPFWPHAGEIHKLDGKLSSAVEISGQPGDHVFAVSPGKVSWAGPFHGYGKMVFIEASNGYVFVYGGQAVLNVKVGDSVAKGQIIGQLGKNPNDGQSKVFFCISHEGKALNPFLVPR
jgi:LysM repeat protein